MSTAVTAGCQWEIWAFAPGGYRTPVQECGLYQERGQADRMAARLCNWLNNGVLSENLLDACVGRDDKDALLTMRESLHDQGIDPAAVAVAAVEYGERSDSEVVCPVPLPRVDAGHGVRGPVGADVRSKRNA